MFHFRNYRMAVHNSKLSSAQSEGKGGGPLPAGCRAKSQHFLNSSAKKDNAPSFQSSSGLRGSGHLQPKNKA